MYPILRYMWGTDTYRESIKVRAFGETKTELSECSFRAAPVSYTKMVFSWAGTWTYRVWLITPLRI